MEMCAHSGQNHPEPLQILSGIPTVSQRMDSNLCAYCLTKNVHERRTDPHPTIPPPLSSPLPRGLTWGICDRNPSPTPGQNKCGARVPAGDVWHSDLGFAKLNGCTGIRFSWLLDDELSMFGSDESFDLCFTLVFNLPFECETLSRG